MVPVSLKQQTTMNPYEYHNDQLCVQARFIFEGRDADTETIGVISDRGFRHRITAGYIKKMRNQGPNTPMLVSYITLPPQWQRMLIEKFGAPAKAINSTAFERFYQRDLNAYDFYMNYRLDDGKVLPDPVIEEYTINASVLNTVEKVYKNRYAMRRNLRGDVFDVWATVSNGCTRFRDIEAHTLPMNAASLRRKLKEYKKEGYTALIHGNWCNQSARVVTDTINSLLNNMFADTREKPTPTQIARRYDGFLAGYVDVVNDETGEIYDPAEFRKLSHGTITNYLAKWTNKVATHTKRAGNRQMWMAKFRPYHSFSQPKFAGSIVSVDDRQPPFAYEDGERPWFYNAIDLGSEAFTTFVWGKDKLGIMLEFYRQMVRNYHYWGYSLPAELEGEIHGNNQFTNTFLKEGNMFQFTHIEANNARGKRIERYYGNLRYDIEKSRLGWLARPTALSEANQLGPRKVTLVPYDKIIEGCLQDIRDWNNTEHSKIKGKTRWEVFTEMQNPATQPTNWRGILPHLGFKTKTSCNTGIINLNNGKYLIGENGKLAYSERLIAIMEQIEGKDLDVYWLDAIDGTVIKAIVYLRDSDRYVCEAVAKPVTAKAQIERTPADLEQYEAMSKYVSSVDAYIMRRKHTIEKVTVIDNAPKTLNDKFQIPQLKQRNAHDIPVYEQVEVMPEPDEFDEQFERLKKQNKKSFKDIY
jgi:hypothetical protein